MNRVANIKSVCSISSFTVSFRYRKSFKRSVESKGINLGINKNPFLLI